MADAPEKVPGSQGLALVQDFVNTSDFDGNEELADGATAATWLRARGFEVAIDERSHRLLLETRERLRDLFAANSGEPLAAASATRLSQLLGGSTVLPSVDGRGVRLVAGGRGVEAFLATILAALVESTIDGSLRRMKVCRAQDCWWAFYDKSKNGSGAWCSMRSCGTRAKARTYRERHRDD